MTDLQPRVLIEDWLPVAELGIESRRERAAVHALPPLSFLHVWWARRPIVASAAVLLGGLLPTWSQDLADAFPGASEIQSEMAYRKWLLHLVGIWGDPIKAQHLADMAKAAGVKSVANPFTYKQAYRNHVSEPDMSLLHDVLRRTWGELPWVADPTAGGGSIPFASVRLGIPTLANDLNPIAASVLKAGVEFPARFGADLTPHIQKWGKELVRRVESEIAPFFPQRDDSKVTNYLFVNAVSCPRTGRLVPLLPELWLRKEKGKEAAVRLVTEVSGVPLDAPMFEVLTGKAVDPTAASIGTVKRGDAVSPYDNLVIDGEYIKGEAQAGRMTQVLYAVVARTAKGVRIYKAPEPIDLEAIAKSVERLASVRSDWEADGFLPTEEIPEGLKTAELLRYGMSTWAGVFSARQLLVHGTFAREFHKIAEEITSSIGEELATAVLVELAQMQGKATNYNSRLSSWHVPKQTMRSVFERHDFGFKWTFAEMTGLDIYSWSLQQITKVYPAIVSLLSGGGPDLVDRPVTKVPIVVTQGSAANLQDVTAGTFAHICMDPPYYDNVMYAELSDFFYVWEKRTLGRFIPEFFTTDLTDKENEAVANPSRFEAMGRRKKELATLDYEAKMTAIFAECRRTLRDDGVLSVMFTHKRAEAWDTLGMGLLEAGFTIETSWPVNTEAENSLHQANMNSAASTIMLVCRKNLTRAGNSAVFLDDIEGEIRDAARSAVSRFQADGIEGVDLLLSTYGPTLSVISQHWPVYSSTPDADGREQLLRPEGALALAREEVVRLRRLRLVGKAAQIDNLTDFVLMAWDIFGAREFPFDTARLLALAVGGLEVDELVRAKVLSKKAGSVLLLPPAQRVRRGADSHLPGVRPEAPKFDYMVDAVDTMLYVAEHDGSAAAKRLLDKHGLVNDEAFLATVQGLVNAIPRSKVKGDWVVPEAGLLDMLVTAYLPSVTLPPDEPVAAPEAEQGAFDLGQ